MSKRKVEVIPYSPQWKERFNEEQSLFRELFGNGKVAIYHIGSTSVPGLSAKPIIDILIEAERMDLVDSVTAEIEKAGYEPKGENGIPGRRFFQKSDENGVRTFHVHAFEKGNPEIYRHLVFRDYLRAHPEQAKRYGEIKQWAAVEHTYDIEGYMDEKESIIKELEHLAFKWKPSN
ncbi:GrpB domain, predicted nucleotidyltransferase, UPF0157 family [Mesobacillus persicus]|uniref:GrpB domain, predicted nucleotidyltransferase, UPF0157 family n=1 Tax=Mesobacillus persicus TaxID=930146 RepID=A0A1H8BWT6_9BACI|nr:GrpB family protein [Mesobacillus persicus]SEM87381.1 GrpB domain, predicted nucleotidyltransferase, UPF0157 family [Mesobacillus persicus]